jgi:hypothetical protein
MWNGASAQLPLQPGRNHWPEGLIPRNADDIFRQRHSRTLAGMDASPVTHVTAESGTRAAATNVLSAIVFREILKPLAAGLGPVGEVAIGSVADTIFTRPKT